MSGIEVVGLVLGTIPLIIGGIEGIRTIRRWKNISEQLDDFKLELESEHEIFCNTIEHLLGESVDGRTLALLFENIGGKLWSDAYVDKRLQTRLARSYKTFFTHVTRMNRSLQELKTDLVPQASEKSMLDCLKRLAIPIKLKEYKITLNKIGRSNQTLNSLLNRSLVLEPIRAARRTYPNFETTRENASGILTSLQAGLADSCLAQHTVAISLRSLTEASEEVAGRASRSKKPKFRVILQHEKGQDWSVEEADLQVMPRDLCANPNRRSIQVKSKTTGQTYRVREINDLCQVLNTKDMTRGLCLGYLVDIPRNVRYGMHWPGKPSLKRDSGYSVRTLSDLFQRRHMREMGQELKLRLAGAISQITLGLHDTPWMRESLGSDHVSLLCSETCIRTEDAYLVTPLAKTPAMQPTPSDAARHVIRNHVLFQLGVLLIELCLEKKLSKLQHSKELNNGIRNDFSDYLTACRLAAEDVRSKAGRSYSSVVMRCIRCDFGPGQADLSNPLFRKAVYDGVVAELALGLEVTGNEIEDVESDM